MASGPSFDSTSNVKESNAYDGGGIYFAPQYVGDSALNAAPGGNKPNYYVIGGAAIALILLTVIALKK